MVCTFCSHYLCDKATIVYSKRFFLTLVQDDNENDEKSEEGGNLLASNKPEVSLGSNGDKHEKASIQDGDEDKLLELREDEKDRGGVDTVDKAKRPESIPIPVMGSPKSPPSSPRQELLQEPVQRKREDSRTEVERQENAAALKTDKSPSRRRKERSPIPADWISEKKLRTSQPTEVCSLHASLQISILLQAAVLHAQN